MRRIFSAVVVLSLFAAMHARAQQLRKIAVPEGVLDTLNAGASEYKAADLQAFSVDLNDDGTPEVAVIGRPGTSLCSGAGNCSFWILQSKPGGYVELVRHYRKHDGDIFDSTVNDWKVLSSLSNGYHDLQFFYRDLPWRSTATRYRMDSGGKYDYVPRSCATVTYGYFEGDKFRAFRPPKSVPCTRARSLP
jgi:hypothetical protein